MVSNDSKYYGDQTLFLTIFSYVFLEDFEIFLVCIAPFIMMFSFILREYDVLWNVKKLQLTLQPPHARDFSRE